MEGPPKEQVPSVHCWPWTLEYGREASREQTPGLCSSSGSSTVREKGLQTDHGDLAEVRYIH